MGEWGKSRRLSPLPPDWQRIRRRVLERDLGVCQLRMEGCTVRATEVDHIGDRDDHSDGNLRAVCKRCHGRRTGQQAGRLSPTKFRPIKRPPEKHPGLID